MALIEKSLTISFAAGSPDGFSSHGVIRAFGGAAGVHACNGGSYQMKK